MSFFLVLVILQLDFAFPYFKLLQSQFSEFLHFRSYLCYLIFSLLIVVSLPRFYRNRIVSLLALALLSDCSEYSHQLQLDSSQLGSTHHFFLAFESHFIHFHEEIIQKLIFLCDSFGYARYRYVLGILISLEYTEVIAQGLQALFLLSQ